MNRRLAFLVAAFFAAALCVGGGSAAASQPASAHARSALSSEHCYTHIAATRHRNLDGTLTRTLAGGVRWCLRDGKTVSITSITSCPKLLWDCSARTTVSRLAGHPQQRVVLTAAKLSREGGTHKATMDECFHISSTGSAIVPCRLHPLILSTGDEQCTTHLEATYRFNDDVRTRWVKGGMLWCLIGSRTLTMKSIADCGSPKGLWSCKAVTNITPLAGHPLQRRSFTLASFLRTINGLTVRRGATECFHQAESSRVRSFCRINRD